MRITTGRVVVAVTAALTVGVGAFAVNGIANADVKPPSQFTVAKGTIRKATGTPVPASGTQASLWGNISTATTTIEGSGRVVVGAIGSNCEGWPTIRVTVDGTVVGETTITSTGDYGTHPVGTAVGGGRHTVTIGFTNDRATKTCDRNVHIGYARMEQQGPTVPGPGNTGVPAGTKLTVHDGDLKITTAGTVIDGLDVRGFILVQATNVTIRRTLVRGRDAGEASRPLIQAWGDRQRGLVVEDTTLRADFPSRFANGLMGHDFTARRVQASNVVDTAMITGRGNVTISDSYFFGTLRLPEPRQPDGWTHDDNLQIEGGTNILVQNNTFEGTVNAAIMVTQNTERTHGVRIIGNHLSGGGCTINLAETGKGPILDFLVQDNRFGTSRLHPCGVIAKTTSTPRMVNNVYQDGTTVVARRG